MQRAIVVTTVLRVPVLFRDVPVPPFILTGMENSTRPLAMASGNFLLTSELFNLLVLKGE